MVQRIEMANSFISDAVAQAWGEVLLRNASITSLNLESNSISSGGIGALAAGLRANETLTELKLANQFTNYTQQAEETLGEALTDNHTLVKLTIDKPRSTRAHDMINKHLTRNQSKRGEARRSEQSRRASDAEILRRASDIGMST